ncbi:MAG: hypothetical protein RMJ54_01070 [Roseiflexaceae bacterium]|nr:hypothetical protein [Roseiflexus sp.]MDW8146178.1 hypothetical protein [Roseiflexaceae bacterium]MDW8231351.1 hypothetical protein [Roseiflexaceae bacterium]
MADHIEAMLHQPLTLAELAGVVRLSLHRSACIFRHATGRSPRACAPDGTRATPAPPEHDSIAEVAALASFAN